MRLIPVSGGTDAVTVAPDGRTVAFGTRDGSVGFVDVRTGRLLGTPEPSHVNAVRDLTFSPDGRRLATTDGSVVFLWDTRAGRPIASFPRVVGAAASLRFSPDGRLLLVADDRTDGSGALDELAIPNLGLVRQVVVPPVIQMEFSRDGKILFSADRAGRVWLLDARTLQPIGAPLLANASRFAVDPSDRLLATSSYTGAVQLWDVRSGRPTGRPSREPVAPRRSLPSWQAAALLSRWPRTGPEPCGTFALSRGRGAHAPSQDAR